MGCVAVAPITREIRTSIDTTERAQTLRVRCHLGVKSANRTSCPQTSIWEVSVVPKTPPHARLRDAWSKVTRGNYFTAEPKGSSYGLDICLSSMQSC